MKAQLYNLKGEVIGDIDLKDEIFGVKWNADVVHQALQAQIANTRKPIAHTKGRGEVRGGGKKPWRQKGTGRARHGSIRSPLWKGGGVTHGPTKDKIFAKKINKKMKRLAIVSALSRKLKDGNVKVVDAFSLQAPKTKELAGALKVFYKGTPHALLVPTGGNRTVFRASRNIPNVKSIDARSLNVYDVLRYRDILIEQPAIASLA